MDDSKEKDEGEGMEEGGMKMEKLGEACGYGSMESEMVFRDMVDSYNGIRVDISA